MNVLIIGCGGVGGYLATQLFQAKIPVQVMSRGEHHQVLNEKGLLTSGIVTGSFPIPVLNVSGQSTPSFNFVLLTTKTQDLKEAVQGALPFTSRETLWVTLQNGIDAEDIVGEFVPEKNIVAGIAYIDARILSPGQVEILSRGRFTLGSTQTNKESLEKTVSLFQSTNIQTTTSPNIVQTKWEKLCWNIIFNPLCALTRATVGEISKSPSMKSLAKQILEETSTVAKKYDVQIDPENVEKLFSLGSGNPNSRTSLMADLDRKKKTEIDYLNGAISRRGKKHGIPTPINTTLVELILQLEKS